MLTHTYHSQRHTVPCSRSAVRWSATNSIKDVLHALTVLVGQCSMAHQDTKTGANGKVHQAVDVLALCGCQRVYRAPIAARQIVGQLKA